MAASLDYRVGRDVRIAPRRRAEDSPPYLAGNAVALPTDPSLVRRRSKLCEQLPLAVPDVDDTVMASREDRLAVRRRRHAQHSLTRIPDSFLIAAARTLLSGVRFEIGVGEHVAG